MKTISTIKEAVSPASDIMSLVAHLVELNVDSDASISESNLQLLDANHNAFLIPASWVRAALLVRGNRLGDELRDWLLHGSHEAASVKTIVYLSASTKKALFALAKSANRSASSIADDILCQGLGLPPARRRTRGRPK